MNYPICTIFYCTKHYHTVSYCTVLKCNVHKILYCTVSNYITRDVFMSVLTYKYFIVQIKITLYSEILCSTTIFSIVHEITLLYSKNPI